MSLRIPDPSLVVLIGPSGSGKSTFARRHFKPTEIVSSDSVRAMITDDEANQEVTPRAFALLHQIVAERLSWGRLTVVDATNLQAFGRAPLVELAKQHHLHAVALVFQTPEKVCIERDQTRERRVGPGVVRSHLRLMRGLAQRLSGEGFRYVELLRGVEEVEALQIERSRLPSDRRDEHGPFDIIGDVHGCYDELVELLSQLGWTLDHQSGRWRASHPEGRRLIFLGDLVDRGPASDRVLELVMDLCADRAEGQPPLARCVQGNHEAKLVRHLGGSRVKLSHGLDRTVEQLSTRSPEFREQARLFLDRLRAHYLLDEGRLVVAHAGLPAHMHGRVTGAVRSFALYGDTTGETDDYGLPVRKDWAAGYQGRATVVYGHTPVLQAEWFNRTIDIDTGCCFGGRLTALRWPERSLHSVPARQVYLEPARPLGPFPGREPPPTPSGELLSLDDINGSAPLTTRLRGELRIPPKLAAGAVEALSRHAVDPRWLIYLPPTMSPPGATSEPGLIEHPREAFEHYQKGGVAEVICEEKHMGSRAVVICCRDEAVARERFRVAEGDGIIYSRGGRRFFTDPTHERHVLAGLRAALEPLWSELDTGWVLLDCELMPWSAKAGELLRQQYAPVGQAARMGISAARAAMERAGLQEEAARLAEREDRVQRYDAAWRRYCWAVKGPEDLELAPFHLLASEGAVHTDKDHLWHLSMLSRLQGPGIRATPHLVVCPDDPQSVQAGVDWWWERVRAGAEGMVVKPRSFLPPDGRLQPALKVRGPEYLRIIYGPEYDLPEHLPRLRERNLGGKRALAQKEFALGVEGLERFIRRAGLRAVHQCVAAVLALESDPVDPRL